MLDSDGDGAGSTCGEDGWSFDPFKASEWLDKRTCSVEE